MTLRWFDRTFQLDMPVELFPCLLERLRGTPARVEDKVRGLPREVLTRRPGNSWSVQEHLGHLLDLDELHYGRLDDYESQAAVLRPADLENRKTWQANHNQRPLEELLADFRRERSRFVARLEVWPAPALAQSALHPRLKQPMRVVDMALFIAEHDDHHLTRMTELIQQFARSTPR